MVGDASNMMITLPYFIFIAYFIHGLEALSLHCRMDEINFHILLVQLRVTLI